MKPGNTLEGWDTLEQALAPAIPAEMCLSCPSCKKVFFSRDMAENCYVCPHCGHHLRIGARDRLTLLADPGTFEEMNAGLAANDPIAFPGYQEKLHRAQEASGEQEAVVTGFCRIGGYNCGLFLMDPNFIMGSLGTGTGEKITRLFEAATEQGLPVIGYAVSGGARMQEGILSLMQMAKTSGAVQLHGANGNLYISVLTNPTTGGVTASFAMLGDIILAEPQALIGFAGPRVIEQTMRQKLPEGFQRAEFLLEKGFIDQIVPRTEQKKTLAYLLGLHQRGVEA